jgi:hypothetical protein
MYRFPVSPLIHLRNMLPSSGRFLQDHYLATGVRATELIVAIIQICRVIPVRGWNERIRSSTGERTARNTWMSVGNVSFAGLIALSWVHIPTTPRLHFVHYP